VHAPVKLGGIAAAAELLFNFVHQIMEVAPAAVRWQEVDRWRSGDRVSECVVGWGGVGGGGQSICIVLHPHTHNAHNTIHTIHTYTIQYAGYTTPYNIRIPTRLSALARADRSGVFANDDPAPPLTPPTPSSYTRNTPVAPPPSLLTGWAFVVFSPWFKVPCVAMLRLCL
jgi:hypothetical protein